MGGRTRKRRRAGVEASEPEKPAEKETQAEPEEQLPAEKTDGTETEEIPETSPAIIESEGLELGAEGTQEAVRGGESIDVSNLAIIAKDKDGNCYGLPTYSTNKDIGEVRDFLSITEEQYKEASQTFVLNFKRADDEAFSIPKARIDGNPAGKVFTELEFKHHAAFRYVVTHCDPTREPEMKDVTWALTLKQDCKLETVPDYGEEGQKPASIFIHYNCIVDGQGHKVYQTSENDLWVLFNISGSVNVSFKNITLDGSENLDGAPKYIGMYVNHYDPTHVQFEGDVVIQNCKNDRPGYELVGSAIGLVGDGSSLTMRGKGNKIQNCVSEHGYGGSICVKGANSVVDIDGAEFLNNQAKLGGAISSIQEDSKITIQNTTFENNKATEESGGAICSNSPMDIKDSVFKSNTAEKNGGSILTYNTLNIVGGSFEENEAQFGGGIMAYASLKLNGGTYQKNIASSSGGAIYQPAEKLDIDGATFGKNEATQNGGAIYTKGTTTVTGSTFTSNKAKVHGGALYVNGLVTDKKSKVTTVNTDLKVTIGEKTKFESNKAGKEGGAIYTRPYQYNDPIKLNDNTLPVEEQKPYENLDIDNTTLFKGNKADGGLFVPPTNYKEFKNLEFDPKSDVKHGKLKVESLLNNYDVNYKGKEPTETAEPSEPSTPSRDERIIVDPNGGTFSDGTTGRKTYDLKAGETFVLPAAPTREGYKFIAWEGKSGTYQPGDKYTVQSGGDVFIARWEEEKKPEEKPSVKPNIKTPKGTPITPDEIAKILAGMKKTVPAIPRAGVGK